MVDTTSAHRFEDGERVLVRSRYVSDRNHLVPGVFKATYYEHAGWRYEVTTEHGTFDVPLHGIQKVEEVPDDDERPESVPTITYVLKYRLVGTLYANPVLRERRLEAQTDDEARAQVTQFVNRTFAGDTTVQVVRIVRASTTVQYADIPVGS